MKKQYFWNGLIVSMGMVSLHVAAFAPSIRYTRVVTQSAPTGFLSSDVQQLGRIHQHHSTAEGKRNLCRPLKMMANPGLAFAAVTGAFTGGLFAGGLHAIAGPDHLAALLPRCVGQRWYRAGRVGALWGMGHGVSATILGISAYALKTSFNSRAAATGFKKFLDGASHVTEVAVGLSLVIIGVMGIREAREWEEEIDGVQPQSLSAAAADPGIKNAQKRAVIFNGLLHGFSWDGAPSLAPAIAVATWSGNLAFLTAYAVGTMSAMAVTTTLIGEGTRRAGQVFQRPDLPQKLSLFSSVLAIAIGVVWCGLALM